MLIALTTLEDVKAYLSLTDYSHDYVLIRLIHSVSEFIQKYCDRKFAQGSYDEFYQGNNRQKLILNQFPLVSVQMLTINSDPLAETDYEVLADQGMLYRQSGWPWDGYSVGLVGEPTAPHRNIRIQYTAGYVLPGNADRTLPYDLEDACIQLVAIRFERRGTEHLKRETIGPLTSEYIDGIPSHIKEVLDRHKRMSLA